MKGLKKWFALAIAIILVGTMMMFTSEGFLKATDSLDGVEIEEMTDEETEETPIEEKESVTEEYEIESKELKEEAKGEDLVIDTKAEEVKDDQTKNPAADFIYFINYLEKGTGRTIAACEEVSGQTEGSQILLNAKKIPGYTVNGDETLSATLTENMMSFNFYYDKVKLTYTINYLEQGTNSTIAAADTVENQTYGDTKTLTAKEIDGYQVVGEGTADITIGLDNNVVTFYYEKKTYKVLVHYVDNNGNKMAEDYEEEVAYRDPFKIVSPDFTGYFADLEAVMADEMPASDIVETVTYTPNAEAAAPKGDGAPRDDGDGLVTEEVTTESAGTSALSAASGQSTVTSDSVASEGEGSKNKSGQVAVIKRNEDGSYDIITVPADEVPLSDSSIPDYHKCSFFGFLAMLLAVIVYAVYAVGMKKRQARLAAMEEKIAAATYEETHGSDEK